MTGWVGDIEAITSAATRPAAARLGASSRTGKAEVRLSGTRSPGASSTANQKS